MKKFVFLVLTTFGLGLSTPAFAGLHIEPWLGYEKGKSEVIVTTSGVSAPADEDDFTSVDYGLRLGYSMLLFTAGVEYAMGSGTITGTGSDTDISTTDLGVFVGVDFPILVRAYATYFLNSKAELKDVSSGTSNYDGKGYKIGIGFTGLPFVSLNLEAIFREYDKERILSTPFTVDLEPKTASYLLSVSLPFDL